MQIEGQAAKVGALVDDPWLIPGLWTVGQEAQDVAIALRGEPWPDRDPHLAARGLEAPALAP